jgi:hypothetical protein
MAFITEEVTMQSIQELTKLLNLHFNWNKARMDCFVGMLIGWLKLRTVNLTELATAFPSPAQPESRYRRIQRFLADYTINFDSVAGFIMRWFDFLENDYYLVIDRTNWQWGNKNINILLLAVVYKGVAIPIYWIILNKKGNSNTRERIALMKRFIKKFGKIHIKALLADREFIGKDWIKWLKKEKISFFIRIKKNAKIPNSTGIEVPAKNLFRFLKPSEKLVLTGERKMTGAAVYISGLRLDDGQLLIVATDQPGDQAIEQYAERWEIETLFGCFKSRGFNLEDTHITCRLRIKRLLVVLTIAFCWAHRTGEWQHEHIKAIKVKKHLRLAKSIFRVGLDHIRETLLSTTSSLKVALEILIKFIHIKQYDCSIQ